MVCGKESDVSDLAYIAGNAFGIIEDVIEGFVREGEGSGIIVGGNFPAKLHLKFCKVCRTQGEAATTERQRKQSTI
jgi:hypothetical protein